MIKSKGIALSYDGNFRVIENDTFTCVHCQKIVIVPHKGDPANLGGHCHCCDALVCPGCYGKPCDHFEKKLERYEASYHARRSYGLI